MIHACLLVGPGVFAMLLSSWWACGTDAVDHFVVCSARCCVAQGARQRSIGSLVDLAAWPAAYSRFTSLSIVPEECIATFMWCITCRL